MSGSASTAMSHRTDTKKAQAKRGTTKRRAATPPEQTVPRETMPPAYRPGSDDSLCRRREHEKNQRRTRKEFREHVKKIAAVDAIGGFALVDRDQETVCLDF